MVERDSATFKYKLGKQLYFLGNLAGRSIEIRSVAKATMERLRDQTRETVNLYVLDNDSRICIQQFESLQSVRHAVRIGEKLPLTLGATGKVLLAYQSSEFIESTYIRENPKRNKEDLKKELDQIVDEMFAKSIDEREVGSSAIATPIFDVNGNVIAALSISGPTTRFKEEVITKLRSLLIEGGIEISSNLGYMTN